jgi:hypothetical protein
VERTGIKGRLDNERQLEESKKQAARDQEQRKEAAARVKAAKRAAGINVKSSPASGRAPRTMDDDLREIANRHYGEHRQ